MTTTPSLKNVLVAVAMIVVIAFFMEKAQEDKLISPEVGCINYCDCPNGIIGILCEK